MWGWVQQDGNSGGDIYTGDCDCVAKHFYRLKISMASQNSKCPRFALMYFVVFVYFYIICHQWYLFSVKSC